jgi:hypothetical protein
MTYEEQRLSTWAEFLEVADFMTRQQWVFRGHDRAEWPLQTSLEREFAGDRARDAERLTLWQFVRRAPQLLPPHLVPHDTDAAAWLGLIQHYGGPTRFLDVTRSPYIALFFAFEPSGESDRVVWAINDASCMLAWRHDAARRSNQISLSQRWLCLITAAKSRSMASVVRFTASLRSNAT